MSRKEKATREYLETLTKDRVIDLCLQFMFDVEVTEQQLEEKDNLIEYSKEEIRKRNKRIDEIVERDKKLFDDKNKELEKLKQQLSEKQNTINEINKEFVQAAHDWKTLCAEKDKEIERLKNLFKLNNEVVINQGKEIFDLRVQVLQQNQNQTQLAIQELENAKMMTEWKFRNIVEVVDYLNNRIKKLKGE